MAAITFVVLCKINIDRRGLGARPGLRREWHVDWSDYNMNLVSTDIPPIPLRAICGRACDVISRQRMRIVWLRERPAYMYMYIYSTHAHALAHAFFDV